MSILPWKNWEVMDLDQEESDIHFYRHLLGSSEMSSLDLNQLENRLIQRLIFSRLRLSNDLDA